MRRSLLLLWILAFTGGAAAEPMSFRLFDWQPTSDTVLHREIADFFRLDLSRMPRLEPLAGGLALENPGGAPLASAWAPLEVGAGTWTVRFQARWRGEGEPPPATVLFLTARRDFRPDRRWRDYGLTAEVPGPLGPGALAFSMRGRSGRLEVRALERVRLSFQVSVSPSVQEPLAVEAVVSGEVPEGARLELTSLDLPAWNALPGAGTCRTHPFPPRNAPAWVPLPDHPLRGVYRLAPGGSLPRLVRWRVLDGKGRVLHGGAPLRLGRERHRPRGPVRRQVEVAEDGVLEVEGRRVFPLGLYTQRSTVEALEAVESLGLDLAVVGPREELVEEAQRRGLEVILSTTLPAGASDPAAAVRSLVERYGRLPLLAWTLVDEPDLKPAYQPVLEELYRALVLADSRPVYFSNHSPDSLGALSGWADIVGLDPYPVAAVPRPLATVGVWFDRARAVVPERTSLWYINQAFAMAPFWNRPPTPGELRAMTWIALNHGARGVLYYSLHDILTPGFREHRWDLMQSGLAQEIRRQAAEIRQLEPYLVSGGGPLAMAASGSLDASLWLQEGGALLAVVNPAPAEQEGLVTLPRPFATARPFPDGEPFRLDGRALGLVLPGYGVGLFELSAR